MESLGRHYIVDCSGCGPGANDVDATVAAMRQAVDAMGATLLSLKAHRFQPQGLTAVAILSESHLALHSWPEMAYVAIDVFTCGETVDPQAGIEVLTKFLECDHASVRRIDRGQGNFLAAVADPSHATSH